MSLADIDFSPQRRWPAWLVPALALALGVAAGGVYRYVVAEQAASAARAQVSALQASLARQTSAPVAAAPELPKERVKAINEAVAALNIPWPAILSAVESARGGQVALALVEPHPKDQTVLVTAQADDMAVLLDFMQRLAAEPPFVKVRPVRQEAVLDGNVPRKQATFEASWEERP